MKLSGSVNNLCRCCIGIFLLSCLLLFTTSCKQITKGKFLVPDINSKPEKNYSQNSSTLKIVSKGTTLKELRQPRIYFRYMQYSIDGILLGAHKLKDDYERNINLSAGEHKLHVEKLVRGMLSARAFILDEGDCYIFTLSEGQTAIFEGKAFPDEEWEKIGFTGVENWEKVDSLVNCYE
ncbi:MAG: hypothetical protein JRI61_07605 [Deltaproteobacteria bacterium]|nr:hypothetical protein [Deltaproteobacteria bacterium]